jgi:hypothetical protein
MKRMVWAVAARLVAATMMLAASAGSAMADWTWVSTFGPQATGATGTGSSTVFFNETAKTIRVQFSYSGLTGNPTVGHIHAASTATPYTFSNPNPAVALGFGVSGGAPGWSSSTPGPSGSYDRTFDVSSLSAAAPTWGTGFKNAHAGLTIDQLNAKFVEYMNTGKAYINIHTVANSNGEIGGFFTVVTPEPGHWALLASGFAFSVGRVWRRKRQAKVVASRETQTA